MLLQLGNISERQDIPGCGPVGARIMLVNDQTTGYDNQRKRPLSGPPGNVLETCLHAASLIRMEVYMTNLFKQYQPISKFYSETKKTFTPFGQEYVDILKAEIESRKPNVVVPMGPASLKALCGTAALATLRGYVMESTLVPGQKVIPTLSPSKLMFGETQNKYTVVSDFKKIKLESESPKIVRPERNLVLEFPTLESVLEWLDFYTKEPFVGFDLEVINYEIACISLSSSPDLAVSIPIAGKWSVEEEMQIWRGIQRVLGNEQSVKVVQNGMFDIPFLHEHNGIVVRGPIHDTMVAHSIMFPDLPKGLNFLGSIYCGAQEYWKGMVKFHNIKEQA